MSALVVRGDARCLPLPDASVDLIVTSPPYFALRSYTDTAFCLMCIDIKRDGRDPRQAYPDYAEHVEKFHKSTHYAGQLGSEATPAEYIAALVDCTREWMRVLKPSGSIFVNLGDKYATAGTRQGNGDGYADARTAAATHYGRRPVGFRDKSLMLLPERYRIACVDELGLIARAVICWSKPNGLPESVTDRVRRSHEDWVHLVKQPRYFAAVDEIREPVTDTSAHAATRRARTDERLWAFHHGMTSTANPLGKLPGSVWEVATEPLRKVPGIDVDHFACVDDQTEILTERGWLRHDQLLAGDMVAGYDMDDNTAVWTVCISVHRYDYDGEMVAVESRDVSMRLTPNHRTVVQRMHTRSKRRGAVEIVRADEMDRYHFIPRSAPWSFPGNVTVGERTAAILGWVAAEGWYNAGRVYLSQSQDVNPFNVRVIEDLLHEPYRTERKRVYQGRPWTEVCWRLSPVQAEIVKRAMPDKLLPWWLVEGTEVERRACLDAFISGDGHRRPDGRISVFQKLRHNLDVLQAIAVTLGYKTTLREGAGRFVLYLTEGGRSTTLRGTSGVGSKVRREHYKGTVWCPTTGTGTFIARRNGTVFITGNSFPSEWPRRLILGWSPAGICTACGEGRRPVAVSTKRKEAEGFCGCGLRHSYKPRPSTLQPGTALPTWAREGVVYCSERTITGYACACPDASAPTRPSVVVDPFGGTGTTAHVAAALGRIGITVDLSADYCRLAASPELADVRLRKVLGLDKPEPVPDGQLTFDGVTA